MNLLIFLAVLSVLVLIHELGHFVAARLFGIKVEEFAMGLPFTPPIVKWQIGETQYAIYPLLFGGFVRMHGEEAEVAVDRGRSFWDRGKTQRLIVILAGVIMNAVLAMSIFVVMYSILGVPQNTIEKVTVVRLNPGGPAELAGVRVEDRIVAVEGKPLMSGTEFGTVMKSWAGLPVNITIHRGETLPLFEGIAEESLEEINLTLIPRANPPTGEGPAGVAIAQYPYMTLEQCDKGVVGCASKAVLAGFSATGKWMGRVIEGLRSIGKSLLAAQAPEGVSGPIGIYRLTGVVAAEGIWPLLELVAVLSVNLAVFNVLPIPALDGGRMLFIWVEAIRRKRLTSDLEQKVNQWGMIFLLGLILLVSLQDVLNLEVVKKFLGK